MIQAGLRFRLGPRGSRARPHSARALIGSGSHRPIVDGVGACILFAGANAAVVVAIFILLAPAARNTAEPARASVNEQAQDPITTGSTLISEPTRWQPGWRLKTTLQ